MRPLVVIEHESDAPAGLLGEWLEDRGMPWVVHRSDAEQEVPSGTPAVISLGSSHAAYEETGWVPGHVALLRRTAAAGIPVLGLCFGAQALGVALGGEAHRATSGEVGWVQPRSPIAAVRGPWFSWHFDAVVPPAGANVLARTDRAVQAYTEGRHVGFQFHPEVTPAIALKWIENEPQVAERHGDRDLRETVAAAEPVLRERAFTLFDWWRSFALS